MPIISQFYGIVVTMYYDEIKDKGYFKKVKPRCETIEWENGEDICPKSLYYDRKLINK